jgi:arabinogalactan endo-1,4-beta-galactosidase
MTPTISLFRRAVLGAVALSATVLLPTAAQALEKGVDISWLPRMEARGYTFKNKSGVTQDCITICKGLGANIVRLRTFVNPSSTDDCGGHCSQSETIALAVRCQNAGLRVMIDFHYGDTWNSVGTQNPPAAWAGMSYSSMKTALYNYTYNFCTALKNAGVTPVYCSPGNEENLGICTPTGSVSNPSQMTGLIMQGYNAIKAVFPTCKVVIHVAQIQKTSAQAMLDAYKANGGQWDVTGFSSYASSTDAPSIVSIMNGLVTRYGKPVMQVEFGGNETNASGTKAAFQTFFNGMIALGSNGLGCFYWEPECQSFCNYAMGAWDPSTHQPTIALDPLATGGTSTGGTGGTISNGTYSLRNVASGKMLDNLGSTTDGSDVGQWTDGTSSNQKWVVSLVSGSNYKLSCVTGGKYLDSLAHTTDGSTVGQYASSSSNNQLWTVSTSGSNYKLTNVANGKCLDSAGATTDGAIMKFYGSSTSNNQLWQFVAP